MNVIRGLLLAGAAGTAALVTALPAAAGTNLVANGSFEGGVSGWRGWHSTVEGVSPGASGSSGALRATAADGWTTYSAYTSPRPVLSSVAGQTYTATAVVRGKSGRSLCLRIREWVDGAQAGVGSACVTGSGAWQSVPASTYVAKGSGQLEVFLYASGVAGESFDLDSVTLTAGAAEEPPADTTAPETTIASGPASPTSSTAASFSFTSSESGSTFSCRLDSGSYLPCSSPASYTVAAGSHVFEVRATDAAGTTDATPAFWSWTVEAAAPPPASGDPVLAAAGDIADCNLAGDEATAAVLDAISPNAVLALGDLVQEGQFAQYTGCYQPPWGRFFDITYPAAGNREYRTDTGAAPYFQYWGARAGQPGRGYYSFDIGAWHVVVLNSNCSYVIGGCGAGSPQEQWLRADLSTHATRCTIAAMHHPRFDSAGVTLQPTTALWQALWDYRADLVVNGHAHVYERFAPQTLSGKVDNTRGIRQITVGTGGHEQHTFDRLAKNSEVRNNNTHGVLKLTLHPTSYDWQFVPVAGRTFTDAGSRACST